MPIDLSPLKTWSRKNNRVNHNGLVIVSGMAIGTLFTLPVVYTYIAERRQTTVPRAPVGPGRRITELLPAR